MELSGMDVTAQGRSLPEPTDTRSLSREQLARRLSALTGSENLQVIMRLLADHVGASHFLLIRYDLIQEQGLDFIVTSNWPFDLVRRIGSDIGSGYARSTELEKCFSVLAPSFSLLPDDVVLPDKISRQYCSLTFCVGRTRFSLMLLFVEGIILSQEQLKEVGLLTAYGASFVESVESRTERDFELTERELECLFWIAEGKTSDEIAVILGISRNTINNYITSVMRKTATKTRSEAIAYAVRNNLV
jgi:DNA-binding CsgD family transcriptional regulator